MIQNYLKIVKEEYLWHYDLELDYVLHNAPDFKKILYVSYNSAA